MKTTTSVKSGGIRWNHNQTAAGVKVTSGIKAGEGEIVVPPTHPIGSGVIVKGG